MGVEKERQLKRKKRRKVYAVYRDGPRPVDVHVGRMVRERRVLMGMGQVELAERVGRSFQLIQKYERGTNRISASMLWELSLALRVPVGWFFEGMKGGGKPKDPCTLTLTAVKGIQWNSMEFQMDFDRKL